MIILEVILGILLAAIILELFPYILGLILVLPFTILAFVFGILNAIVKVITFKGDK